MVFNPFGGQLALGYRKDSLEYFTYQSADSLALGNRSSHPVDNCVRRQHWVQLNSHSSSCLGSTPPQPSRTRNTTSTGV